MTTASFTITATTTYTLPTGSVLHYIDAAGSDSNDGLSPTDLGSGHGPWATPNHTHKAGDITIVNPGTYSTGQFNNTFGNVTNVPSTTGGIDGTGGVYFAILLAGGDLGSVIVTTPGGASAKWGVLHNKSNWCVQGFVVTTGYTASSTGFAFAIDTSGGLVDHIAWINNVAYNNGCGYCAASMGANSGAGFGADYWAIVGNIAQDSAGRNDGFWDAAIDVIGTKDKDTNSGTHIYVDGNFSYNNQQTIGGVSDGECYMFDTLDALGYSQQTVFRNNIGVQAERFGLLFFYQNMSAATPLFKVYNNTFYGNNKGNYTNGTGAAFGEIHYQSTVSTFPWIIRTYNNIAQANRATQVNGGNDYALVMGGNYSAVIGNTGSNPSNSENILKGLRSSCDSVCNAGNDVVAFNGGSFGVNTYTDPQFNNTTDLLANQMGTPIVSGFDCTVKALGYNAFTGVLANPSFIYDLMPTAVGTASKGYQKPSNSAVPSDADFPTWLKAAVYLKWTGSFIEQRAGLITMPRGY